MQIGKRLKSIEIKLLALLSARGFALLFILLALVAAGIIVAVVCGREKPVKETAVTTYEIDASLLKTDDYFTVLSQSRGNTYTVPSDFSSGESYGNAVSRAIYDRDSEALSEYDIEIRNILSEAPLDAANEAFLAGEDKFDLFVLPLKGVMTSLMSGGRLADVCNIKTINLDSGFYDKNGIRDLSFGSRLYVLTGELITSDDDAVAAIIYNDNLADLVGIDAGLFESMVAQKLWTLDEMYTIVKDAKSSFKLLEQNAYGISLDYTDAFNLCLAASEPLGSFDSDGTPHVSLRSDKLSAAFHKVLTLLNSNVTPPSDDYKFADEYVLFEFASMAEVGRTCVEGKPFGVLPLPLGDGNQKEYKSPVDMNLAYGFAVPSAAKNKESIGAAIEALSLLSKQKISPAYDSLFDFKYEYSDSMLKTILGNKTYDIVDMFDWVKVYDTITALVASGDTESFSGEMTKRENAAEKAMDIIYKRLATADNKE